MFPGSKFDDGLDMGCEEGRSQSKDNIVRGYLVTFYIDWDIK